MQEAVLRPEADEYPDWFAGEIELVKDEELISGLKVIDQRTLPFLATIPEDKLAFRYQPGKWNIREVWQHVTDVERILAYRALRYSRGDLTVLAGFDEAAYVQHSGANGKSWKAIQREFEAVRLSTIALFESFNREMLFRKGTTGRSCMTVRAVGFLILGHEVHHLKTLRERYL